MLVVRHQQIWRIRGHVSSVVLICFWVAFHTCCSFCQSLGPQFLQRVGLCAANDSNSESHDERLDCPQQHAVGRMGAPNIFSTHTRSEAASHEQEHQRQETKFLPNRIAYWPKGHGTCLYVSSTRVAPSARVKAAMTALGNSKKNIGMNNTDQNPTKNVAAWQAWNFTWNAGNWRQISWPELAVDSSSSKRRRNWTMAAGPLLTTFHFFSKQNPINPRILATNPMNQQRDMLWVINVTRTKPAAPCDVTTQGCAVTDSKSQGFNIWRIRSRLDRTARKEILHSKLSLNRIKRANVGRLKSTVLRRSVALTWHNLGSTRFIGASNVAREVFWKRFPKFPRPENEPADQLYKSRRVSSGRKRRISL